MRAIAARDAAGLLEILSADVEFKAMTPRKFWEESSAADAVDKVILGKWFEESDHIDAIDAIECGTVAAGRQRVRYRFSITNADGAFTVEQQAYYDVVDGRISWMRVICAGYLPVAS